MQGHVVKDLGLVQGDIDAALFNIRHPQVENAHHGHGALAHLLVGGAADQGDTIAHVDVHGIGQPLADENDIGVVGRQVAPSNDVLGRQVHGLFLLGLDAGDFDGESPFAVADEAAGVNAQCSRLYLRICEGSLHNGGAIGQGQQWVLIGRGAVAGGMHLDIASQYLDGVAIDGLVKSTYETIVKHH